MSDREEVVIVGMAGRFPGAVNVDELWDNLRNGVESIRPFTPDELAAAGVDPAQYQAEGYVAAGAPLEHADAFDASFFGYAKREAEIMDPQHRVFLECAWAALEDAGYDPMSYPGVIGVFGGVGPNTYRPKVLESRPDVMRLAGRYPLLIGSEREYAITRVAFKFGLRGPAIGINTACSTSGVALHMAVQSVLSGECDMAIAGGGRIQVPLTAGYLYEEDGILSPDGHCRTFDAAAKGTVIGNGVALVVIKRMTDAVRDGDSIRAIIKGTAVNNDGSDKIGFTAPSVSGQMAVIREALDVAEVDASTIGYVEAHGTGTFIGDPIEMEALTKVFRQDTDQIGYCHIGSIKSNIGHLDAGAGMAGVIKAVLAMEHGEIPPTLNYQSPNPQIDFASGPFVVAERLTPWPRNGEPRRAGISTFGLGGTNAHVVLEEAPVAVPADTQPTDQLLVVSAKTAEAADRAAARLAHHLNERPDMNRADVAHTLLVGRSSFSHRRAIVVGQPPDPEPIPERFPIQGQALDRKSVWMFPGSGAQYVGMGRRLYESQPVFRGWMNRITRLASERLETDLLAEIFDADELERTTRALPALLAVDYGLAKLLESLGLQPDLMIGHSLGEYTAACLAGVFSVEDATALVTLRGELFESLPAGAMVSVPLTPADLRPRLGDDLSIAVINRPDLCVVAGEEAAVDRLMAALAADGVEARRLPIVMASHSHQVEPILERFGNFLANIEMSPPTMPFISNLTGEIAVGVDKPDYWVRHLRNTVLFYDGLSAALAGGPTLAIELGPGQTLTSMARQHPSRSEHQVAVPTLPHRQDPTPDDVFFLGALGKIWAAGAAVDLSQFNGAEQRRRIPLPTYPFERTRYWIEPGRVNTISEVPPAPAFVAATPASASAPTQERRSKISARIVELVGELSGLTPQELDPHATFLELGFDSLFMTQASAAIGAEFSVRISFRQLFEEAPSIDALAGYLDARLEPSVLTGAPKLPIAETDVTNASPTRIEELVANVEALQKQMAALLTGGTGSPIPAHPSPMPPERTDDVAVDRLIPVTDSQQEIWLAAQHGDDANRAYNLSNTLHITGSLDLETLRQATNDVIARHESLRSCFSPDGDTQLVKGQLLIELPLVDLSELDPPAAAAGLEAQRSLQAETPFDLAAGPLIRGKVIKLAAEEHFVFLTVHHAICDGWSSGTLLRNLADLYNARRRRQPAQLDRPMQLGEYVDWFTDYQNGEGWKDDERFWVNQVGHDFPVSDVPGDRPRPERRSRRASRLSVPVAGETAEQVRSLAMANNCTPFTVLLSSFECFLQRLTGKSDIGLAVSIAGQSRFPGRDLVAHCINALPLRRRVDHTTKFRDHLQTTQAAFLDAYDHQDFSYGAIVKAVAAPRDSSRPPLVSILFNFDTPARPLDFAGALARPGTSPRRYETFDFFINVRPVDRSFVIEVTYNTDLFDVATVERRIQQWMVLLADATTSNQPISRLRILPDEELTSLSRWNDTKVDWGATANRTVDQLVSEQVARTPWAIAMVAGGEEWTYERFDRLVAELCSALIRAGVVRGSLVGVLCERSVAMVAALHAVIRAGGAYVPLDPSYPADRLAFMIEETAMSVILTDGSAAGLVPSGVHEIDLDPFVANTGAFTLRAEVEWSTPVASSDDPAYVIYTSGSTGRPKGVRNNHRAVVNQLLWMQNRYPLGMGNVVLLKTPFTFDVSVWEFFWPLMNGATLVISEPGGHRDPAYLVDTITGHRVDTVQFVPSMLRLFLDHPGAAECTGLRRVICIGEALTGDLVDRFFQVLPDAELHNLYGPTEAAIAVTSWQCTNDGALPVIPIGGPIANTTIHILDHELQPAPIGVAGELYIGGVQVAPGYVNRDDLTAERFLGHPAFGRIYKTGDLARWLPEGVVDFLGRLDHQVKIRGQRIELGEIESTLGQHPSVLEAAVTVQTDGQGDQRLVAYLFPRTGSEIEVLDVRAAAARLLPTHMIPNVFVVLDQAPLTTSGKLDRNALPPPPDTHVAVEELVEPRTDLETEIAEMWCTLLGTTAVGVEQDFFELGGHSLKLMQLAGRFDQAFGVRPPLASMFEYPTIAGQAVLVTEALLIAASGNGHGSELLFEIGLEQTEPAT